MKGAVPFEGLLDALADAGVQIGVNDRVAFAKLLARYDGASATELRDAIASLLAANAEEIELIREIFDKLYVEEIQPPEPVVESPPPPPSRWRLTRRWLHKNARWVLPVVATALVVVVVASLNRPQQDILPPDPLPPTEPTKSAHAGELHFERAPQCPPRDAATIQRWPLPTLGLAALALVTFIVTARQTRRRVLRISRGVFGKAMTETTGARNYEIVPDGGPIESVALADMTAALAAALGQATGVTTIDVDRTVEATVRAGLVPTLITRPRTGFRSMVALIDMAPESKVWHDKARVFLDALRERGVDITRLYFERNPLLVSTKPLGKLTAIETHAARLRGLPLVIFGVGAAFDVRTTAESRRLHRALEAWPARVLFHPIDNPSRWPAALTSRRAPVATFPLTPDGVRKAALELGAEHPQRTLPTAPQRSLNQQADADGLRRLVAMLAFAPRPTFALALALRRAFLPDVPEDVVLAARGIIDSDDDARSHRAMVAAMKAFQVEDPGGTKERQVRQFVLDEITRNRPADEHSAAFLRWRCDRALATMHLASTAEEKKAAEAALLELATTAVAPELQDDLALGAATAQARGDETLARALQSVVRSGNRRMLVAAAKHRRPWFLMDLATPALVTILLTGVAAGGLWRVGAFPSRPARLDGTIEILWSQTDLKHALCTFDGYYDIIASEQVKSRKLLGLAVVLPQGDSDGMLSVFSVEEWFGLKWFRATNITGSFEPAGAQNGAIAVTAGGKELRYFVRYRDNAGARDSEFYRDESLLLPNFDHKKRATYLLPAGRYGWTPIYVKRAGEGGNSDDMGKFEHFTVNDQYGDISARLAHDRFINAHSNGIAPGTSEEILQRILDRNAPRWAEPKVKCDPPLEACGDSCVQIEQDNNHCGSCGTVCGAEQTCKDGVCVCNDGSTACGDRCADLKSSREHCGRCGNACSEGACVDGNCTTTQVSADCPDKTTRCGDSCVDLMSDRANCGACGKSCTGSRTYSHHCKQGRCEGCYEGYMTCRPVLRPEDGCETRVSSDVNNCGACGNVCRRIKTTAANTQPACSNSKCTMECLRGFYDCNGNKADGCESINRCTNVIDMGSTWSSSGGPATKSSSAQCRAACARKLNTCSAACPEGPEGADFKCVMACDVEATTCKQKCPATKPQAP